MAEVARRQTTETIAKLYDGKLRLERRNGGSGIYARTYIQGKLILKSTGQTTVHNATKIATDWYLDCATARGAANTCTAALSPRAPRHSWSMRGR